ncbi:MAG: YSC84-related protein [Acidobacteriota bacterium]|nr:YSC84-related protein [Acidobacteriota bacterium]MDH3785580.1 YSC84-related protein [Acidobacteriota bacterium]
MKSRFGFLAALLIVALAAPLTSFFADEETSGRQDEKRAKISTIATEALHGLLADSSNANSLYENAYGYAVFDNWKFALGVSGGGGTGVAVDKAAGSKTYMKMGTGGVGLGLGGQKYQLVVMMETKEAFDRFVNKGWQADAQGTAAAGKEGVSASSSFHNGIALFQITDKGLMANADVTGTKFWKHKKLN